ncbi:hypothetical protein [Mycobacterium sp. RTGN5]|nr:hypothetical protein [Mycobacterium sp. RTGN5]
MGFALFAGAGMAAADGHNVVNPDGTLGAADGNNSYGYDMAPV